MKMFLIPLLSIFTKPLSCGLGGESEGELTGAIGVYRALYASNQKVNSSNDFVSKCTQFIDWIT